MGSTGRRLVAFASTTAVVLSPLAIAASPAMADARDGASIHVVSPATAGAEKWTEQAYENLDDGAYTNPEQTVELSEGAPLGRGARFFSMGQYSLQTELYRTTALDGDKVSDISRLDYSTWAKATGAVKGTVAGPKQPPYLRLSISSDGTGTKDTTLNFEPAENGAQGAIKQAEWQDWETAGGRWHVVESPGVTAASSTAPADYVTLADYVAANPAAELAMGTEGGALSIVAGASGANQTYAKLGFDRVAAEVGSDVFLWDLEPDAGTTSGSTTTVKSLSGTWNTSAYNYSGNSNNGSATAVRQTLELGPKAPPRGKGSVVMEIGDNSDATQFLRSTVLDGKPVSSLRTLGYSTYAEKTTGSGATTQQPPYLRLSISSVGSATKDTTLNFEPANNSAQGPVKNDAWQTWNAFDGRFRVVEGPGETADDSPASFLTLAAYMARHPKATFVTNAKDFGGKGALSFVVGGAADNQRNARFAVDNVSVGTSSTVAGKPGAVVTNYDLERDYTVPTVNSTSRRGAGPVTLTGTAGAGDKVEVRTLGTADSRTVTADWSTVAGTVTADSNGRWTLRLAKVSERTGVRAWLAGTYGSADIASTTAYVQVGFNVALSVSTSGGYTYGYVTVDPAVGAVPIVWEQYVNKRWVKIVETKTNSKGVALMRWNTSKGRTYVIHARAVATKTVFTGTSAAKTIRSS
jgi:hypothetical protein